MTHKILAVQNCGPSGSTLVQSLLDAHPSIMSLPALHALELVIFWEAHCGANKSEFYEKFIHHFRFYYKPELVPNGLGLRELGDHRNELACVDEEMFTQKIKLYFSQMTFNFNRYLTAVYRAYHECLGRPYSESSYILYPIHSLNKRFAKIIVDNFECVRFLYTIREPVQAIGSAAKHINKDRAWDHLHLLSCIAAQMVCDFTIHVGPHDVYGMRPYFEDTKNFHIRNKAIRLEDVHRSTREVMEKICAWLDIPWNDNLLKSTFNGLTWHNRPESIRQSGVGAETIKQNHTDILTKLDKYRFKLLTMKFSQHYQYQTTSLSSFKKMILLFLIFLPFRMENLADRKARKNELLNSKKQSTRFLKHLPAVGNDVYLKLLNIKNGLHCRMKWIIPAILGKNEAVKANYVELL